MRIFNKLDKGFIFIEGDMIKIYDENSLDMNKHIKHLKRYIEITIENGILNLKYLDDNKVYNTNDVRYALEYVFSDYSLEDVKPEYHTETLIYDGKIFGIKLLDEYKIKHVKAGVVELNREPIERCIVTSSFMVNLPLHGYNYIAR